MKNAVIKDIRITDKTIIRKVMAEQKREGDRSATRTAGKIIERYFALRDAAPVLSQPANALAGHT